MAERSKHIISSFDAALEVLKNDVLMMSSLTDQNFHTAIEALLNRDSELCNQVIADDEEVDILEKTIDQDGVNLLLRFQPVASDMREVISAMKVSTNLERIADHAVTIARGAKHLNDRRLVREVQFLEPPYRLAVAIFRDSIRAYADADYDLAQTLKPKDSVLGLLRALKRPYAIDTTEHPPPPIGKGRVEGRDHLQEKAGRRPGARTIVAAISSA